MKVSEAFPSRYAKPVEDLKHGMHITIESSMRAKEGKDFDGNPATQYEIDISYDDNGTVQEKIMQLNAGNAKAIAEIYGDDDAGWQGKAMSVVLIPSPKSKSGKRVVLTPPGANYQ